MASTLKARVAPAAAALAGAVLTTALTFSNDASAQKTPALSAVRAKQATLVALASSDPPNRAALEQFEGISRRDSFSRLLEKMSDKLLRRETP